MTDTYPHMNKINDLAAELEKELKTIAEALTILEKLKMKE